MAAITSPSPAVPGLKRPGIGWFLHDGIVVREPGRMRVARIQGGIFEQAKPPSMRRLRSAATV